MSSSDPVTVKVTTSPSASIAFTVPMDFWFSLTVNVDDEVISGA